MTLGMTREDEGVYRYLAEHGETPAALVARGLGLDGDAVADSLGRLRERGYVVGETPDARRPDQVFAGIVRGMEAQLFAVRARVAELQELYDRAYRPTTRGPVALLTSRTQAAQAMDDLELGATSTLEKMITAPYTQLTQIHPPEHNARRDSNGVVRMPRRRVIFEQAVVDDPRALPGIRNKLSLPNTEVRVAEKLPYKLVISDEKRALVPVYPPGEGDRIATHLITGGNDLTAHQLVFERCWQAATPLSANADNFTEGFTAEELQLLQLLVGGSTNEAIARLLNVNVRTVARRLTELRERAGVTSRAALITHAATQWMR
jgi:DNA-binding CsgD family transcriptional regulator